MNLIKKKTYLNLEDKFLGCAKEEVEQAISNAQNFEELNLDYKTILKQNYLEIQKRSEDLSHSGDDGKGSSPDHKVKLIKKSCHLSVFKYEDEKIYPVVNMVVKPECRTFNFLVSITPFGMLVADGMFCCGDKAISKCWVDIYNKAFKETGNIRECIDYREYYFKNRKKYDLSSHE